MPIFTLYIIISILLIGLILVVVWTTKGKEDILLHNKIDSLREELTNNIVKTQANLVDSSRIVSNGLSKLYEKIGSLDVESREILNLTKDFHDILKPTKSRGIVGESILENILRDVLPKEAIVAQYSFRDGKKVDFAILIPSGIVPIDAKFSLEVFNNYIQAKDPDKRNKEKILIDSIKKRIIETASYVYPDEGTTDFSLMYVPSEAVYYFIITETSLLEFAHQKKVFVVGPNTFYAYLKTIFVGFQALKIEKKAKQIYNDLKRLEKDMATFIKEYTILGTHIRSASLKYDDTSKKIDTIYSKLNSISGNDNKSEDSSSL